MKRLLGSFFLALSVAGAAAQRVVGEGEAQRLDAYVPAGNYSGLCRMSDGLFAVVDDKSAADGFHVWRMDIDSAGQVLRLADEGLRASGLPNRDGEGICLLPPRGTILVCGEKDNCIREYRPDGTPTGLQSVPLKGGKTNSGLEGLCWDEELQCVWAMEENNGQDECRLLRYDTQLQLTDTAVYALCAPRTEKRGKWYAHGVSEILACGGGRLLVLERELYVPKKKIGAWVEVKLCLLETESMGKTLLWTHRTRLNATARSWANYEGMCWGEACPDGTRQLLLLSDSQNRHAGMLHDWLKVLRIEMPPRRVFAELMTAAAPDIRLTNYCVPGDSNVYSRMAHHGVAFESELVAYRVYFDHRQNIDLYGKRFQRLELADTHFYPTPQQQEAGYGNDVLWAGARIGCGTLRLWDGETAAFWRNVAVRGQRIVENYPNRVVVEMVDSGCRLPNADMGERPYDIVTRYTLEAGSRQLRVDVTLDRPLPADMAFCTGVQDMGRMSYLTADGRATATREGLDSIRGMATWGTDFPEQSSAAMRARFPAETVGLCVWSPRPQPLSADGLLLLGRKGERTFRYYVSFCADKEEAGFHSAEGWFAACWQAASGKAE